MISNPIMHDIVKSILKNNADGCFNILREYYGSYYVSKSKLFGLDRKIIKARDEVPLVPMYNKDLKISYIDVIWEMNTGHHIFHEVKSGQFDINSIYENYVNKELTNKWENHKTVMVADKPLFIWAWNQYISAQEPCNEHLRMKIKYGHVKLFPIEILSPYIKYQLEEIIKSI